MESFSEHNFEEKLFRLKDSQDSISNLSSWCLNYQEHSAKIVSTWLSVLKKVNTEHKVLLFYLANDVIQYSKRKNLPFHDGFAPALQKGTTLVRSDRIRNKILRLFKIWDDRHIYDETFLIDLSGLLTKGYKSTSRIDIEEFQPSALYSRLKSCKSFEDDTDGKMKVLNENEISLNDIDKFRSILKDRHAGEDVVSDIEEGIKKVNAYVDALEMEIKERKGLLDLLEVGEQYYDKEYNEAKVVVNAYKCFTGRVRGVKRKLEVRVEEFTAGNTAKSTIDNSCHDHFSDFPRESSSDDFIPVSNKSVNNKLEIQCITEQSMSHLPDSSKNVKSESNRLFPAVGSLTDKFHKTSYHLDNNVVRQPDLSIDTSLCEVPHPNLIGENEIFNSQASKADDLRNSNDTNSEDSVNFSNDCLNTFSSVAIEWGNVAHKDLESPESPPLFEKAGFLDFSSERQDIDMRIKDVDHRNFIAFAENRTGEPWSPTSDYCGEMSPVSLEDNVENIDMDLSDEDDIKSKCKRVKNKDVECVCVACVDEKSEKEIDVLTKQSQANIKGYYTKTSNEQNNNHNRCNYQISIENYSCDSDLREKATNFSCNLTNKSKLEKTSNALPPLPPPPLPPPPPPPIEPIKEDHGSLWNESTNSYRPSELEQTFSVNIPFPPPSVIDRMSAFPNETMQSSFKGPNNFMITGFPPKPPFLPPFLAPLPLPNNLAIPLIPPPPPPMQVVPMELNACNRPIYYANSYSSSAMPSQSAVKIGPSINQNEGALISCTENFKIPLNPHIKQGYSTGSKQVKFQNAPQMSHGPPGGFLDNPPFFANQIFPIQRRTQLTNPYDKFSIQQNW